jgi:hypothetical protein
VEVKQKNIEVKIIPKIDVKERNPDPLIVKKEDAHVIIKKDETDSELLKELQKYDYIYIFHSFFSLKGFL